MLAKDIFDYLKSYGYKFKLYDTDGNGPVLDFDIVEYMYAVHNNSTLMIVIEPANYREYKNLYIYKTPEIKKNTFRKILTDIKRMGNIHGYTTTVKSFGRKLTPKDFAILPKIKKTSDNENEIVTENKSFEEKKFKRTSHLIKEKAKVVLKHSGDNRHIKEMYVVSKGGEKRKVTGNSLSLGKAIANHVNAGGNLYDNAVNHMFDIKESIDVLTTTNFDDTLTECNEDQKESIKKFVKEARKQINKYIGTLARRKKKLDECMCDYNKPEHTFSKSFFGEITNDDLLANKLANISLFISIINR